VTPGPGTRVGPYVLGRRLGRGGMAVVHEATHESTGRVVALKLISAERTDPEFADRLRREGRVQAALDHPNVVTVYEAGTSEHGPWLAMRLVEGVTLADLIDEGSLDAERALALLDQVAAALDAAHAAGLVHRDVKPRNILVGDDGAAYLADFGLSRPGDGMDATATGHFMGTLAYAAPEVLRGAEPGPAADRYALAAVLFECLTGSVVFPRPSHAAVVFAHTNEPPPAVSGRRADAPRALDAAVVAGLAKDPADRPATARALVGRARAALRGARLGPPPPRVPQPREDDATTGATLPVTVPESPVRGNRRTRLGALAVTAVVAAVAGGGAVALLAPGGDTTPAPAGLPAPPPGSERLGSDLSRDGRTVDCRGRAVSPASPACTVFQDRDANVTLVVPRNGVVRRWTVRAATGEMALAVVRRRDDGYFQTARSRNEFVGSADPHAFTTDLAVEQGDRLALVVVRGGGVGLTDDAGATTGRWLPPLRGLIATPEAGATGELLLRVDYVPGATPRTPRLLEGAAAAAAPEGTVLATRTVRSDGAPPVEVRVAMVGGRGVLDLLRAGGRFIRMDVPGLAEPRGDVLQLGAYGAADSGGQIGVDVWFTTEGSDRLVRRFFNYVPGEGLAFIN